MITEDKITEIFCLADDFCKYFSSEIKKYQPGDGKKHRNKPCKLSEADVITILILFHSKGFRCLKHFYTQYVCKHMRHLFPQTVSYNRFVELQKSVVLHLTVFIKEVLLGTCTGVALMSPRSIWDICLSLIITSTLTRLKAAKVTPATAIPNKVYGLQILELGNRLSNLSIKSL